MSRRLLAIVLTVLSIPLSAAAAPDPGPAPAEPAANARATVAAPAGNSPAVAVATAAAAPAVEGPAGEPVPPAAPAAARPPARAAKREDETGRLDEMLAIRRAERARYGYGTAYGGAVFRPQFCLRDCRQSDRWQNRFLLTYGVEVGERLFGFALRYGQERRQYTRGDRVRTVHDVALDLRVFHGWKVGPVLLTPFFEASPVVLFGGASGVYLVARPGFRLSFLLARHVDLALEPFALDVIWFRWERIGSYRAVDLDVSLRYSISLSVHARW